MQTQGLLQESSLASLLQTMQTERATGALALENESETASLYFLFGHLFHAAGAAGQGEDVVLDALGWHDGSFRFDPRAKLPPEETIKSSPTELIAEAERRAPEAAAEAPEEPGGWGEAGAGYEQSEGYSAPAYEELPENGYAEPSWTPPEPEPAAADQQAATYAPWSTPEPAAPAPAPAAYRPAPPPVHAPSAYRAPRPEAPPLAPAAREPLGGAPSAAPLDIIYPLPAGRTQYEGLKSGFVDFPKLLRTLRGDQHTGYIRLTASDFSGTLLFREGHLLDALSSTPGATEGEPAFQAMRRTMDAGSGSLDVVDLDPEVVDGLTQLLASPLLFTGLLGRFVNFDALLAYLAEEAVEGAVLVVGGSDIGIILLSRGHVLGAYTRSSPALSTATTAVGKIAADKAARIEVKSGSGAMPAIDVESVLTRAY